MAAGVPAVPAWVVPLAAEVDDLYSLAQSEYDAPRGNRPQACGIVGALRWVSGSATTGPVTGRLEQPVTAALAKAECWAARATADSGGTQERRLQAACVELGVAYWPPNLELVDPEEGHGVYQTLSWLLGWSDGYRGGRVPPLPVSRRNFDGSTVLVPQQRSTGRGRWSRGTPAHDAADGDQGYESREGTALS